MADQLATTMSTRIADLSPSLSTLSTRSIRALVTLIWPYSSSNSTLTVLLAEPDFRLRKANGQVRVRFSGSSARTVFESGIGSGDEVLLSLDGVEWLKDDSVPHTPGRSVEWELKYAERLLLQVQENGTKKITLLDIDHPEPQLQQELMEIDSVRESPPSPPETVVTASRPGLKRLENSEWASPAFIKRARVSYGSLFESGYDMFADDNETVLGKGRKRSLFSRGSNSWRYSSRSASPEAEALDNNFVVTKNMEHTNDGPVMTDEACQTIGLGGEDETETLANPPVGVANVSKTEPVGKAVMGGEVVSAVDGSSGLMDMAPPDGPILVARIGVQEESNGQEDRTEEKETTQLSPRLHSTLSENPPTEPSILPSTPTAAPAPDGFHGNDDDASLDMGKKQSQRGQYDFPNQDIAQPQEIKEVEDLSGFITAAHSRIKTPAEELRPSQMLLAQEYTHAVVHATYPDPEASLNSEHYPRSPYYGEDQEHPSTFAIANKPLHYPDVANDTINLQYDNRPHPDTSSVRPPNATSMMGYEEAQYSSLQNPSIHDTKALRPNTAGIMMSRSQSAQSEVIDLTEDSDEEDSGSEDVQSYADYDEGPVREEYEDVEEGDDYDEDEDEDDDENHRYSDGQTIEGESMGEDRVNLAYSRETYWDEGSVDGEEVDDYDEVMGDQREESYGNDQSSDVDDGSAAVKQLPRGQPEVIDLLSSDDEGAEENDSNQPTRVMEVHGSAIIAHYLHEGEIASDQDADGEVEEYEGDREEENIEQGALFDAIGMIQAERVTEDPANSKPERSVGSREEGKSESRVPGDQGLAEVQRSTPEAAAKLQHAVRVRDLRQEFPHEEEFFHGLGGYDGVNDDVHVGMRPLSVAEVHATTTGEIPLMESANGEIKHAVLPLGDATEEEMADPEAKAPQDDQIMTEGYYALHMDRMIDQDDQGDQYLSTTEGNAMQDEHTLKTDQANFISNGQLPTPDATQITTVTASEPLFHPNWESEPVQESQHPPSEPSIDTQIPSIQGTIQIEEISTPRADQPIEHAAREDSPQRKFDLSEHVENITQVQPREHMVQAIETNGDSVAVEGSLERPSTPQQFKPLRTSEPNNAELKNPSVRSGDSPTPEFFDASATLAMAALDSPSNREKEQDSPILSDIALRVKLSRPLRTRLAHFTTLKLLRYNLEKKIDVLAVATSIPTEPSRAKNGPRHFHLHFKVTDGSLMPTTVIPVHIFRPFKVALPSVKPGEGVLLRSFIAKAEPKAGFGLRSDESSSWVVFKEDGEEEVRGPPVEFGDEEREHVVRLDAWYRGLDAQSKERLERGNVGKDKEN